MLTAGDARAQTPADDFMKKAFERGGREMEGDLKKDQAPAASPAAAPAAAAAATEITARQEGDAFVLADGRRFDLKYEGVFGAYPEFEMKEPLGARVELWLGDKRLFAEDVPFLYKEDDFTRFEKYLKLVVREPGGTWSLKFVLPKGKRTVVTGGGGAKPAPVAAPAPAPAAGGRSCKSTLLAKGHHSMHLDNCKGVDDACAVLVLEAGHHPQQLSACTPGLPARCVQTLLAKGHHPMHLESCQGVDETCAVQLLERGEHPMNLSNCK
jgi:hypothetical protein